MIFASIGALLLSIMGVAPLQEAASPPPQDEYAQLVVRKQIIIRSVRVRPLVPQNAQTRPLQTPIEWRESRGPKCVPLRSILGAVMLRQSSVDFIMRDKTRIRARLESECPALDYYYGFYLTPSSDGMICADRDSVRSRMGGVCVIAAFHVLRAVATRASQP